MCFWQHPRTLGFGYAPDWLAVSLIVAAPMRMVSFGRQKTRLAEAFIFFPLAGGLFSRAQAYLHDVALAPATFLLVLLLAARQIFGDATMNDLVAKLEIISERIPRFSHRRPPSCLISKDITISAPTLRVVGVANIQTP